ncbi:hypothetical protein SGRIM128S_01576 [Streptomyces griseomycini]
MRFDVLGPLRVRTEGGGPVPVAEPKVRALLAERAAPLLHGRDQRHWLHRLDAETLNLRAALDRAVTAGDRGPGLRLVNALTWYWYLRGRFGEAVRSLRRAVECADPGDAPAAGRTPGTTAARTDPALASARVRRAVFALFTGDAPATDESFEGADAWGRWLLSFARCGFGGPAEGGGSFDALTAEFRKAGDRWGEAAALSTLATQALYEGDLEAVRRHAGASAALFAEVGDLWGQLQASEQLGVVAEVTGDYAAAARLHQDGVRGAEELQLWSHVSFRLARLGRVALLTGDDARATELHERARRLADGAVAPDRGAVRRERSGPRRPPPGRPRRRRGAAAALARVEPALRRGRGRRLGPRAARLRRRAARRRAARRGTAPGRVRRGARGRVLRCRRWISRCRGEAFRFRGWVSRCRGRVTPSPRTRQPLSGPGRPGDAAPDSGGAAEEQVVTVVGEVRGGAPVRVGAGRRGGPRCTPGRPSPSSPPSCSARPSSRTGTPAGTAPPRPPGTPPPSRRPRRRGGPRGRPPRARARRPRRPPPPPPPVPVPGRARRRRTAPGPPGTGRAAVPPAGTPRDRGAYRSPSRPPRTTGTPPATTPSWSTAARRTAA